MKCSIEGFNQQYALSLSKEVIENGKPVIKKIDVIDLVILRWFTDFYHKMVKIEFEGKQYAWIDYNSLLEDIPLLDMGKDNLYRRLKKLVFLGVLKHYTSKNGGTFSYYTFGENFTPLLEISKAQKNEGMENFTEGYGKNYGGGMENFTEQNNQSIKYNIYKEKNIINNILKESVNDKIPVNDEEKEKNNELVPQKKKKKKEFGTLDSLTKVIIDTLGNDEDIIRELQEFIKMRNAKNKQLTDYAMKLTCNKLLKLSREKEKQIAIIQQSIIRNWEELYDIKDDFSISKQQKPTSKLPEYKYYE